MKLKKILSLTLVLIFSACSGKNNIVHKNTMVGLTSSQIVEQKGQPESITDGVVSTESTIYTYNQESFQIINDKVSTHFRAPESEEVNLQYWMQKWQQIYEKKIIENPNDKDHKNENFMVEYRSKENISVIYDRGADRVVRVVYYE